MSGDDMVGGNARNLHPTPEAIIAMCIWSSEYSRQGGGCMDFWDSLSEPRRRQCSRVLGQIEKAAGR